MCIGISMYICVICLLGFSFMIKLELFGIVGRWYFKSLKLGYECFFENFFYVKCMKVRIVELVLDCWGIGKGKNLLLLMFYYRDEWLCLSFMRIRMVKMVMFFCLNFI